MSQPTDLSGRDAETVALFVEESLDGLQAVERLLLDAESGQAPADMMGTLFRAVHTIKGTAGYLAYDRTQALAHAAEDLLSRLRDKKLAPMPVHFTSLVTVGDRLRLLVNNVKETGEEGDVEIATLVDQLHRLLEPQAQGAATQAVAPPAVLQVTMQPAVASTPVAPDADATGVAPVATKAEADAVVAKADHEPPQDKAAATGNKNTQEAADSTVRVNVAVLDRLMNLIGELVLARNQMVQLAKSVSDVNPGAQAACQRLNVVTSELQEQVMKTRMQPVARVFEKIPRMVRDVARVTLKQVATEIEGNNTEIDKALVEAIRDPVMHIVRNAIDHGIETGPERLAKGKKAQGTVYVRAAHKGGAVTIEVEDDGRGMDPAFIRAHAVKKGVLTAAEASKLSDRASLELVFRPGFSTAAQVTDISGRGVGMDVVRTHVERAGGQAEIESVAGKGTTIRLKMPLTLAIIPALLVWVGGQRFAIPQVNLLELVYLTEEQAKAHMDHVRGAPIHRLRGETLPVVNLAQALGLPPQVSKQVNPEPGVNIVVLSVGSRRYSMMVEAIDNTEEIVIKPMHGQLKRITSYSGATVLGDGGVALILDVAGVAIKAGLDLSYDRSVTRDEVQQTSTKSVTMMVFLAGDNAQCAIPLSVVARLESIKSNAIETVAGAEVLQYRGSLVPIVRPEAALPIGSCAGQQEDQLLIVFDFGQPVAMAVNSIVDTVDVTIDPTQAEQDNGLTSGKTVILGRTTLILDAFAMMCRLAPSRVGHSQHKLEARGRVLVMESSEALRSSLSTALAACGVDATGVGNVDAMLKTLGQSAEQPYEALVLDGAAAQGTLHPKLLNDLKKAYPALPVVVWTSHENTTQDRNFMAAGAYACVDKLHRESLVQVLRELAPGPQTRVEEAL